MRVQEDDTSLAVSTPALSGPVRARVLPRLRDVSVGASIALASCALMAVALDAALRVWPNPIARRPASARLVDDARRHLLDCYPSNPRGYFDVDLRRPDDRARFRHLAARRRFEAVATRAPFAVEFRYDAEGFREEPAGRAPSGMRRVLLIGDSFTEGQGVKAGDTSSSVLRRRLEADPDGPWEVRNYGRRGADFPMLQTLFSKVVERGADVVVYAMVLNDAVQSPSFAARQEYLNDWMALQGRLTETDVSAGPGGLGLFLQQRLEDWRVSRASVRCYRDMYAAPNSEGWAETQRQIRAMDTVTRAQGGRFALVLWPWLVDLRRGYPFEEAHRTIARFCAEAGIPFLDLRPVLAAVGDAESLRVHPVDWHANEEAHEAVGKALAPLVRDLGGGRHSTDDTRRLLTQNIPYSKPNGGAETLSFLR